MGGDNVFQYAYSNPMVYVDPDGKIPVKAQAGTLEEFTNLLGVGSRSHVGNFKGKKAEERLINWGKFNLLTREPNDSWLNTEDPRYIYTKKGGWIDMQHFMFYAGKAYSYSISQCTSTGRGYTTTYPCHRNPVGDAVQFGYRQERLFDSLAAPHSAYTYEDLPSDRYGALFGAQHFDPNSNLTLNEQISNYIQTLEPADPTEAPNYNDLPDTDHDYLDMYEKWRERGTVVINTQYGSFEHFDTEKAGPKPGGPINKTTNPMYTK